MALPPFSLFFLSFFFVNLSFLLPSSADLLSEGTALLFFREAIGDPDGAMANWNMSNPVCQWRGITCGAAKAPAQVTELTLVGLRLSGKISPSLSKLVSLAKLDLSNNTLEGSIPRELCELAALQQLNLSFNQISGAIPQELGQLSSLQKLDLSTNSLSAEIPESLGKCSELISLRLKNNLLQGRIPSTIVDCNKLQNLSFFGNQLSGEIPPELGSMKSLRLLQLSSNNLSGPIPSSLGSISALTILDLATNSLSGSIPPELGNLSNLVFLYLFGNELSGGIPPHLGNLSRLNYLYLYENQLEGEIPFEIGGARNLKVFDVYSNRLSGTIPFSLYNLSSLNNLHLGSNQFSGYLPSDLGKNLPNLTHLHLFGNQLEGSVSPFISNASAMEVFELAQNRLSGVIPSELGKLQSLEWIDLSDNYFKAEEEEDWRFIASLANCRGLAKLELYNNRLGGALPSSIANLSSKLEILRMERNKIEGTIPEGWGSFVNLGMLRLGWNQLTGRIPDSIGNLKSLKELLLEENELSGEIPSSLGNLSGLLELSLGGNQLQGNIPASFGALKNLQELNLSTNSLTGEIPREILSLVSLTAHLDLSGNNLVGPLWPEIGKLKNLNTLNLSRNRLSGEIPAAIGDGEVLQFLLLADNLFQGPIPPKIGKLAGLQELDLSGNRLTGELPEFLEELRLRRLNLSNNFLQGKVPDGGIFKNATATSLFGNADLCADNPELLLRRCSRQKTSMAVKIAVPISAFVFAFILTTFLFVLFTKNRKRVSTPADANNGGISYEELRRCTGGFSSGNLIGRGAHGCVYGGKLGKNRDSVAVKVIELGSAGAARSFMAEFQATKNIRHRNLVKTIASFSGVDQNGNEFMALVYELLPNGSLDQWIHREESDVCKPGNRALGLAQRLSIAIDVASAIEYLHNCIEVPIIHGDLKPGNVLLDRNMTARVGDFGLARFLSSGSSHCSTRTVGLKGTIGYVAPELATLCRASAASDVYSLGILLLELFAGKRPTDPTFDEGSTLRSFVEKGIPRRVVSVVDPKLLQEQGKKEEGGGFVNDDGRESMIQCLISVFKLGLLCSEELEKDRPKIAEAVRALTLTRDVLFQPKETILLIP